METLNDMIKNNRDMFENNQLPEGHKDRFLKKVARKKFAAKREFVFKVAAAVLIFAAVSVPWIFKGTQPGSFLATLERESSALYIMAQELDPLNRAMVINTLDQLTSDAVLFSEQLPDNLDRKTAIKMSKEYYGPKIDGVGRLRGYVSELLEN